MRTPGTRSARRLTAAAAAVLALGLAPSAASAKPPVTLHFEKDCPVLTCNGSLVSPAGKPVPGSSVETEVTPLWPGDDILHYSAIETITARQGKIEMQLLGILDFRAEPDITYVMGTVESGTWRGRSVAGAGITAVATRAFGTTFRGVIHLRPAR